MRTRTRIPAVLVATALVLGIGGCSPAPDTRVTVNSGSEETTDSITPLERGVVRREALAVTRTALKAWTSSDKAAMKKSFSESIMASFEKNWKAWEADGLSVKHVHEEVYLDVIDMSKDGTEALVTYRYNDTSYLVDASGKKVEALPAFKDKEIQFTLQVEDETWKIVRAIAGENAYR